MGCLISHGECYSIALRRSLLGQEHLFVQGWPCWHCPMHLAEMFAGVPDSWQLSQAALKDVAGNSIHLHVMHVLWMWLLGSIDPDSDAADVAKTPKRRRLVKKTSQHVLHA
eukprot:6492212-Amphidinium_carterae.5